ncbi:MAG: heterocyst frequency control protein PatD [Okeania sp. SIO3C4]|nr:heterocyst frequency control protein PatD [Okeania sp. SIO3C4]
MDFKKIILTFLSFLLLIGIHAQEQLSFDEALSKMEGQNLKLKGAELNEHYFERKQKATLGHHLPKISLTGLYDAVQSAQTEVNRLMRLLGTDVTFLRSAKQADTQSKRLGQVSDRLSRLLEFCDGLLAAPEES